MLSILCPIDILGGETQDAEWGESPAEQGRSPGNSECQPRTPAPGRSQEEAEARAGVSGERKSRLTGSGDISQHPDPIAPGGAPGSRDMLSGRRSGVGAGGGFVLFLDFAKSKELGKL